MKTVPFSVIAVIHTAFPTKFGIPRQSGLVPETRAEIVFEPEYKNPDALRGIEGYSHLWLLWEFSDLKKDPGTWSPTVRPPRLGGNVRMGVFATRSPYRPNPVGLSSVKLEKVLWDDPRGPVLVVSGADLLDGTPIFDIKPYLAFTDSHPDACGGFADEKKEYAVQVTFPEELSAKMSPEDAETVRALLGQDPRPSYQRDPDREYGMEYKTYEILFRADNTNVTVTDVKPRSAEKN